MRLADLPPQTLEKTGAYRYDRIVEKHEGPFYWKWLLDSGEAEFLELCGYNVLLPVERERHPNITVINCIASADGQSLTIFLKDTTYAPEPQDPMFDAGFMTVCHRLPDEDFYLAVLYHEWFIIDNQWPVSSTQSSAS